MARVSDEVLAEACQAIRAWDSTRPDADEPPLYQTLRAAALDLEEERRAAKEGGGPPEPPRAQRAQRTKTQELRNSGT